MNTNRTDALALAVAIVVYGALYPSLHGHLYLVMLRVGIAITVLFAVAGLLDKWNPPDR